MIDTEFLDYCDGWNLSPKDLKNASKECIISASNMGKKALYFECMRRFLGWNPIETLKRTFLATTRYAESVLYLQLRRHYKTIFPSLNVNWLDEVYAEDNFF